MSFRRLADFLERLDQAGELARINCAVSPRLEAAEIVRRTALHGGPAICFGSLEGHNTPIAANLLGTESRIALALGVHAIDEVAARLEQIVHPEQPEGWFERLKTPPYVAAMESLPPRTIRTGPCQQVVRLGNDVDLQRLPWLQAAPDEARLSMCGAILFTVEPSTGRWITSRCPLELVDPTHLAVCLSDHDAFAGVVAEYVRRRQTMPLAAVLGGSPLLSLAASMPSAPGSDVCRLAALLQEKPIDVVKCRSIELQVPAEAEIVLEGQIVPAEPWAEVGPLAAPTGFYRPAGRGPTVQITAMTERASPVVPALIPGPPPNEETVMRRAMARILLPLLRLSIPGLADYDLPLPAAARHMAVLAIEKSHAGQAHTVAHAAWGSPWLRFARLLVVVDAQVDVRDPVQVERAIACHFEPGRDVILGTGPPDPIDPAAPAHGLPRRLAMDATGKLAGEYPGPGAKPVTLADEIMRKVTARWPEYKLEFE